MDACIELELHNAIFHDPRFVERFLSGDRDKLQNIEEHCRTNNSHYNSTREWLITESAPDEPVLYEPIVNILNTIKRAVDQVHPPPSSPVAGAPAEPPQLFVDSHNTAIPSDLADTNLIKPDLVLFQDSHRHWESVRMPVKIKTSPGLHKAGMKQLSGYARATFAHQLHRRHLYGMLVCRTEATFVRFDRAGILYSKRIDVVKDGKAFTRAFASLLMLDRVDEGYDPAFTFERNEEGRLVYYIDLPESAFVKASRKSTSIGRHGRMQRFKVTEILYHRGSICGRATIVLRIREELETEAQDTKEYALKIIWRDPEHGSEGEILGQIHGRFGLAQSTWHCDVSMTDKTVQVDGLQVCDKLRDIYIVVPPEGAGEAQQIDTTECRPTSHVRPLRMYSYILMESIGVPLWQAESPRRFLTVVLDAILGYWGAFNLSIIHRDISDGNVLMLNADQEFSRKEWLEPRTEDSRIQDPALIESEATLRSILEEIGHRDPTGILTDFDLSALHPPVSKHTTAASASPSTTETVSSRPPRRRLEEDTPEPTSKRRKTNTHTAAPIVPVADPGQEQTKVGPEVRTQREKQRLIDFRTTEVGTRYNHHFLDDLESFFWLILWAVAAHLDKGKQCPTPEAQQLLDMLNQDNLENMSSCKLGLLTRFTMPKVAEKKLNTYANEWASDPMFFKAITNLGTFLSGLTQPEDRTELEVTPGEAFAKVVRIFLSVLSSDG
ncbi:hypothetical protein RSAG8_02833, partial [Rhizoctonia solani AG-8 WAC10335]